MHILEDSHTEGYIRTFIHNLPYEFSYLVTDWEEEFIRKDSVMASAPHKPFKCVYGCFEFLCSYKVSNRSLSEWGGEKCYDVEHKKIDNGIDYDAIHYPDTELTEEDWKYMYHDVISVKECLLKLMEEQDMRYDKLLPTSTMYVKNEVTKKYMTDIHNYWEFSTKGLNYDTYTTLRKSFVGGITHANWQYLNETIRGDIAHYDYNSHYPTQMITKLFPVGKVYKYCDEISSRGKKLSSFTPNNKYAYWVIVDFVNLRLRDTVKITMPYISKSKCEGKCSYIIDNGRLVQCEGTCRLYLSSYDIKWILKQYTCDGYVIREVYRSKLGKLPKYLTDTILECYLKKCKLKGVKGMEIEYNKSKNVLNGLYGVCATDPIRDIIEYDNGEWSTTEIIDRNTIEELLDKYYHNRKRWTRYEWGTWVTSLARDELMTCIELVGYDNFLYCDTDSIFFIKTDENIKAIEELNKQWRADAIDNNYSVTDGEHTWYMHCFDAEPALQAFRTLGAKCYAMEEWKAEKSRYIFKCVIAGVPSKRVYIENGVTNTYKREEELGNIDALTTGFIFNKCVPTRSVYTPEGCVILNSKHNITVADSEACDYYEQLV